MNEISRKFIHKYVIGEPILMVYDRECLFRSENTTELTLNPTLPHTIMNRSLTPIVLGLIVVNVLIHIAALTVESESWLAFQDKYMLLHKVDKAGLHSHPAPPGLGEFNPVQPLGSSFAHSKATLLHLIMNMMCLYFFGPALEKYMGSMRFLVLYLFSAVVGGFLTAYFDPSWNPSLGASGAISGLLVAFAWLFPQSRMGLMFIPVYIPSRIFTALFAAISLWLVVQSVGSGSSAGGISHAGHLAGMIGGFVFMLGYLALFPRKISADFE